MLSQLVGVLEFEGFAEDIALIFKVRGALDYGRGVAQGATHPIVLTV